MDDSMITTASLEQLICDLNDPRNQAAPERVHLIQRNIQRLQRESAGWQAGLALLGHDDARMRFYGALTLTIKVNADWDVDNVGADRELVHGLLEELLGHFTRLAAIPDAPYVLQKLSTTLVAVFIRADAAWALPIRHLLACTLSGSYVAQANVPDITTLITADTTISAHQLKAVLMLALTLAEEIGNTPGSASFALVRYANSAPDVWRVLDFCVDVLRHWSSDRAVVTQPQLLVQFDEQQNTAIAKYVVLLVPFWTPFVKSNARDETESGTPMLQSFKTCVEAACSLVAVPELAVDILQTFTSLEQTCHGMLHKTLPTYAAGLIGSQQAALWLEQLLRGSFDAEPLAYVDFLEALMNQADVTSPSYLRNDAYTQALGQLSRLLRCDGVAGIDDTVCAIALEVLTSVVEGFNDWDDPSVYGDEIRSLIAVACRDSIVKIRLPASELSPPTQTWDADDRSRFQDFRYDVQDFLQNAFTVIGTPLIEDIVQQIVSEGLSDQWAGFEANLFALVAFSDVLNGDADHFDRYLDAVFDCPRWKSVLTPSAVAAPERVRKIAIKLFGEATGFLERHPRHLLSGLNFLFESLHITSSATSASRAIFALCDSQRAGLVEALPQFIGSLNSVSDLDPDSRSRIFGAVSAIVQALPVEVDKVEPLSKILDVVGGDADALLAITTPADDELRQKATDLVWTLATVGKGLRAPSDSLVNLEADLPNQRDFWTNGDGKVVQQRILHIFDALRRWTGGDKDSLFIEATCDLLKSAFTEEHPSPMKFTPPTVLAVLCRQLGLASPQPDIVLGTATSFLASVQATDLGPHFAELLSAILIPCREALELPSDGDSVAHSEFCAAALAFFARLLSKSAHTWLDLADADQSVQVMITLALKLLVDADTLPRRTAASFLTALFEAGNISTAVTAMATVGEIHNSRIDHILQDWAPRIIAAIVYLLGGECARSELDALGEPLKRAVQRRPLLVNKILKEAFKAENGVLSPKALRATKPEQRARFASQIEMLRGARKTTDVLREFWIACRGSNFDYVV